MMNFNKTVLVLLLSLGSALAVAVPSQAQKQSTFASITGDGATSSNVFTYTSGAGGGFGITPGAIFSAEFLPTSLKDGPVTVSFTGLNNIGTASGGPDYYTQTLSGGSFDVESNGTSLLNGTFTDGDLLGGAVDATTSAITNKINNVTFTGGTYFGLSGLSNPGSFSISMTSVDPAIGVSGGYFNSFTAGGTGTFSATKTPPAVPEPATVVPFVLGGLGLLVLAVRKNRRTSSVTA